MPVLIIIAVIVLIGGGIYLSLWLTAKRRKELSDWGAAHGLGFSPARDASIETRFAGFSCLHEGRHRYAYNVLSGSLSGRDFLGFDYHYETQSHSNKGTQSRRSISA